MLVPMSSNWKGGKWKAMEWEKARKEWEGEALLGEEDETWEGDRQAWEKDTGSQQQGREEEVTRLVGFALLPELHPLHLHFGDRTFHFLIFIVRWQNLTYLYCVCFLNRVEFIVVHRSTGALISKC